MTTSTVYRRIANAKKIVWSHPTARVVGSTPEHLTVVVQLPAGRYGGMAENDPEECLWQGDHYAKAKPAFEP